MTILLWMPVGDTIIGPKIKFPISMFKDEDCDRWHGQSAQKLAARGGLDWTEAASILLSRVWQPMDMREAELVVRDEYERWKISNRIEGKPIST